MHIRISDLIRILIILDNIYWNSKKNEEKSNKKLLKYFKIIKKSISKKPKHPNINSFTYKNHRNQPTTKQAILIKSQKHHLN